MRDVEAETNHVVERRCEAVRENGEPCRGIPALGQTHCHAHARYRSTLNGVLVVVPLMEDEASVTFVRSQTVRALSQGSIPPANGQAMLLGCRDAERRLERELDRRLEVQRLALRYAALAEKMGEEKLERHLDRFMERLAERVIRDQRSTNSQDERSAVSEQRTDDSDQRSVSSDEKSVSSEEGPAGSEAAARSEEPEPVMHRSVFPNVKEQWDQALERTEGKILEVVAPKEGESWHEFMPRKKMGEAAIAAAV